MGENVDDFEQGYTQEGKFFSRKSLYEQIHLWVIRGLLAIIRERGMVRQTIPYVQQNFKITRKVQTCTLLRVSAIQFTKYRTKPPMPRTMAPTYT